MASTSTRAKKSGRQSGPTWSKIAPGGAPTPSSKSASSKRKPKPKAQQTARSAPRPRLELPAHLRREMVALMMLVVAALFAIGLFSWSRGSTGMVGMAGEILSQLFGVAAWLAPVALLAGAIVLLVGARSDARWLSPMVPFGSLILLLGLMGFLHLFAGGQEIGRAHV